MDGYRAILGAVRSGTVQPQEQGRAAPPPFVTIARQAGAGGNTLNGRLVARLNGIDRADPPWTGFDRELVEKVAQTYELSSPLLETLDESSHSYMDELLTGFKLHGKSEPSELAVYRRVAKTIRALAQVGRVVIVGRGGVFLTQDMPVGLHVYLVAPLEQRVAMAREARGLSRDDAAEWVKRTDAARESFYRRHWPGQPVGPEAFSVTFNTAAISDEQMVESMVMGGRIAMLGIPPGRSSVDWSRIVFRSLTIKGVYGREIFETWYKMIALIENGLDVRGVITHRLPAASFAEAFDAMQAGGAGKVVLDWG